MEMEDRRDERRNHLPTRRVGILGEPKVSGNEELTDGRLGKGGNAAEEGNLNMTVVKEKEMTAKGFI